MLFIFCHARPFHIQRCIVENANRWPRPGGTIVLHKATRPRPHAGGYTRLISSSMAIRSVDGNHYLCKVKLFTWLHGARLTHVVAWCKTLALWQRPSESFSCFASSLACLFDFLAEDLVEVADQHFRWTFFHDVPDIFIQARGNQTVEPAHT